MTNSVTPHRKFPDRGEEQISIQIAFSAMHAFLLQYWERDGKPEDSIADILSWTQSARDVGFANAGPADPAMWGDWLESIDAVQQKR